jgi:hypothetical protein
LSFNSAQPFNKIVIHYDAAPPTGGDYGPIFMADNLLITPSQAPIVLSAVSRKTHGVAGNFDVDLPVSGAPGVECRAGGATNDYQVIVTFGSAVTVNGSPQAQVTMGNADVGVGGVSNGGVVNVTGTTVTVPLTNVANAQLINITLKAVNDGSQAGDVVIPMVLLKGDINGNLAVNATDVAQTKGQLGHAVSSTNFRNDINGNGNINATDVSVVKANSGTSPP